MAKFLDNTYCLLEAATGGIIFRYAVIVLLLREVGNETSCVIRDQRGALMILQRTQPIGVIQPVVKAGCGVGVDTGCCSR